MDDDGDTGEDISKYMICVKFLQTNCGPFRHAHHGSCIEVKT